MTVTLWPDATLPPPLVVPPPDGLLEVVITKVADELTVAQFVTALQEPVTWTQ
jgi:hypothetical protein